MSIYMGHKYLLILNELGEIYPHVPFPDDILTKFPITFFLTLLLFKQHIECLPTAEYLYNWPYLFTKKMYDSSFSIKF